VEGPVSLKLHIYSGESSKLNFCGKRLQCFMTHQSLLRELRTWLAQCTELTDGNAIHVFQYFFFKNLPGIIALLLNPVKWTALSSPVTCVNLSNSNGMARKIILIQHLPFVCLFFRPSFLFCNINSCRR
jgi:hypothetical protein